jgi:uncharacterized membrane protein YeaQ/YmgE (transglycosylase-associated protein family)
MENAVGVGIGLGLFLLIVAVMGAIIGLIARAVMPGPNPMSIGMTIVLGIAGSVVAGLVSRLLNLGEGPGWVLSILGAVLLLWLVPKVRPSL